MSAGRETLVCTTCAWLQSQTYDQRSRLMDSEDTLATTSGRITNAQRIGEESEQIGAGVLNELGRQRETIVRTAHKVCPTHSRMKKPHPPLPPLNHPCTRTFAYIPKLSTAVPPTQQAAQD